MKSSGRKKHAISVLVPFFVFIILFSIFVWQKYRTSHEIMVSPPSSGTVGSRTVTLFFVADGTRLARETRDIGPCSDTMVCLKSALEELLNGPIGDFDESIPDGTSVDAVRMEGDLVTINFNSKFSSAMVAGSSAEMLAVYAVVNTVTVNFPLIKMVKLNVAGDTAARLRHLDLTEPLQPDFSLEQTPTDMIR